MTAIAITLGGTSAATAAPAGQADQPAPSSTAANGSSEHTATAKMTQVRVTKLITRTPDRAGNVKVQLENGKTISIPASDKNRVMRRAAEDAKAPRPKGRVHGPCGSSHVTLGRKSNGHPVSMRTGFDLKTPATSYVWIADISGPGYSHDYHSVGTLAYRSSWEGRYQSSQNQGEGNYTAKVAPRASFAVLWIGVICYSGGPTETKHLTEAKADCLKSTPDGAVSSRNGWIRNTTQWVPWRNKTTNPPDGPGYRADQATACLGKPLEKGSRASGDITGLRDAELFVDRHAPGTKISRCHLIASTLGGKGQIEDGGQANLVPCFHSGMNVGKHSMRHYEAEVKKAVRRIGSNDAVKYQVSPNYQYFFTSTIPESVIMSATVERANGKKDPLFTNERVANTENKTGKDLNLGN
ncbi:DNA/RNA non-specific endonuclease [Streptomyces sp. MK37H]|uniref:DNA/RNA non-specific endonuclease n=1 Tax=Streptomyces sp. MK37H TaxID=2699117 RepID=UPI001B39C506|nr:DNA/RNA non-specific endonuclease [Streptomyces sp. MK37H]MBP8537211.1 hypothetical protein [Streptomyces sp. MK37H]